MGTGRNQSVVRQYHRGSTMVVRYQIAAEYFWEFYIQHENSNSIALTIPASLTIAVTVWKQLVQV